MSVFLFPKILSADRFCLLFILNIKTVIQPGRQHCHGNLRTVFPDPVLHSRCRRKDQITFIRKPFHISRDHSLFGKPDQLFSPHPCLLFSEKRNIMQVVFIPCVIRINNRDLILPSKIQCLRSHKHRLMHMNAVKLVFLKSFPDFSADQLRIYHAVFHLLTRHLKPDDIVLFHLPVAWIKSIIRCEDRHLVSLFPQFFCQPLHGNRNSADKRLIVIRKHRNLHDVSPSSMPKHEWLLLQRNIRLLQTPDSRSESPDRN